MKQQIPSFLFIQDHKNNYHKYAEDSLKGLQISELLEKVFFSPENIAIVQNNLKRNVYTTSGNKFLIPDQSEQDLIVVMRAVFLTNASHNNTPIKEQIAELNKIVVDNLTPNILSTIQFNNEYLRIINNPISPIDRPKNVSSAGNKTLPSVNKLF